jgi:hypothetical protein
VKVEEEVARVCMHVVPRTRTTFCHKLQGSTSKRT